MFLCFCNGKILFEDNVAAISSLPSMLLAEEALCCTFCLKVGHRLYISLLWTDIMHYFSKCGYIIHGNVKYNVENDADANR